MNKRLKKAQELEKDNCSLDDGIEILKKYESMGLCAKFDETVDVSIGLGIDPSNSNQMVRGSVVMPNGLGKKTRVAVIASEDNLDNAKDSGADVFGSADLIDKIKNGFCDFDVCITTPSMMPQISKIGKILGPKGLMPNPKLGTVSEDLKGAVQQAKHGKVDYRSEKGALIHAGIGKLSFDATKIRENILALYDAVLSAKPSDSKGIYIKKCNISSSMGISVGIDISTLGASL